MFVTARRNQYRRLGDGAQTARNVVDAILPDWWLNYFGGPANTPLSPQERQSIADAQVRANGIDPATNKVMPQYAQGVQKKFGVDTQDPSAMKALADSIRADQLNFLDNYFKSLTKPPPAVAFPWGKVLGWGAVGLLGTVVLAKAM